MLFNVWINGQHSKTTVLADDMNDALDRFCALHGFIDHRHYCQEKEFEGSNINIESVY